MKDKTGFAVTCLHISALLYLLIGLVGAAGMFILPDMPTGLRLTMAAMWVVIGFAMILLVEVVAWGLRRRKFWAWVVGIGLFALYVPSLFLPLGAVGLYGLLVEPSRRAFGVGR